MINSEILHKAESVVHPENDRIPLAASHERITSSATPKTLPHFHDDMELLHITEGKVYFQINQVKLLLKEGDCLIINAGHSHSCDPISDIECAYNCIVFKPEILSGNSYIQQEYISSVTGDPNFTYLLLSEKTFFAKQVASTIDQIVELSYSDQPAYELEQIGKLHIFFSGLYSFHKHFGNQFIQAEQVADETLKSMITFMKVHYADKLSLDTIAAAGHVSRSKCCRIFKEYSKQTPMATLNFYRLEISRNLLRNTDETISTISKSCGFPNQSYYNKVFLETYHCTPKEFRNSIPN